FFFAWDGNRFMAEQNSRALREPPDQLLGLPIVIETRPDRRGPTQDRLPRPNGNCDDLSVGPAAVGTTLRWGPVELDARRRHRELREQACTRRGRCCADEDGGAIGTPGNTLDERVEEAAVNGACSGGTHYLFRRAGRMAHVRSKS